MTIASRTRRCSTRRALGVPRGHVQRADPIPRGLGRSRLQAASILTSSTESSVGQVRYVWLFSDQIRCSVTSPRECIAGELCQVRSMCESLHIIALFAEFQFVIGNV
jgi:hypothetical protein